MPAGKNHSLGTDLNECLATRQLGTFLFCRQLGTVLASPAGEPARSAKTAPDSHLSLSPMTTLAGCLLLGRHRLREPGHAARHRHLVGKASRGTKSPSQNVVGLGGLARNRWARKPFCALELEQEESGALGERTKLGHLADPDIAVACEARQRQLKKVFMSHTTKSLDV